MNLPLSFVCCFVTPREYLNLSCSSHWRVPPSLIICHESGLGSLLHLRICLSIYYISFETAFRDCTKIHKINFISVVSKKKKKKSPVHHPKQAIDLEMYGWGGQSKGQQILVGYRVGGVSIKIRDLENCTSQIGQVLLWPLTCFYSVNMALNYSYF